MQDEMFRPNQREIGTSIAPKTLTEIPHVKLISKKQLTENEIRDFANGEKAVTIPINNTYTIVSCIAIVV